jgi:hypothetical protein
MKIGPKDPSLNVPSPEPDDVQQKKTDSQFSIGEGDETRGPAAAGPGAKDAVQSAYAAFTDKAQLADHLIDSTTGDFKGSIGGSDLQSVRQMISNQMEEDPYIQNKLDRIMSLAKAR